MKRYWLCKTELFIHMTVGKIYLETDMGIIDDIGMTRYSITPSKQYITNFDYNQFFEEISFNHYIKLLQ